MSQLLHRVAREHPDAFERAARMRDDELCDLMLDILDDEVGEGGRGRD